MHVRVCVCISILTRGKREKEIRFTVQTGSALWRLMGCLDVPLLRTRSARKNLSANVGRGYVGEPSPLVPFGISPYVPHFLSLSISLSRFNSTLSHRLRASPFSVALLFSVSFPLPVSPFLASLCDNEMTLLSLSLNLVSFSSCLCAHSFCIVFMFFFIYLSYVQCSKELVHILGYTYVQ